MAEPGVPSAMPFPARYDDTVSAQPAEREDPRPFPCPRTTHQRQRTGLLSAIGGPAGAVGTQSLNVFDLAIGRTGLLHHEAQSRGFDALAVPILDDLDSVISPVQMAARNWALAARDATHCLPRVNRPPTTG